MGNTPPGIANEAVGMRHAMQNPAELGVVCQMLADARADWILEIGCMAGGTLWAWRELGINHRLGVTLPPPGSWELNAWDAKVLYADSHLPSSLEWVRQHLGSQALDAVFIDGDHTYDGACADLDDYGGLVHEGGLIVLHDIVFEPGVAKLWAQLRGAGADLPGGIWRAPEGIEAVATEGAERPGTGIITARKDTRHGKV